MNIVRFYYRKSGGKFKGIFIVLRGNLCFVYMMKGFVHVEIVSPQLVVICPG
jgi:hypothetical protein